MSALFTRTRNFKIVIDKYEKKLVLFKAVHGSFCLTDVLNTVHGVISFDRELNFNEIYPTLSNPKSIKNLKIYALISFDYLKNHINFNTIENGKLQHRN